MIRFYFQIFVPLHLSLEYLFHTNFIYIMMKDEGVFRNPHKHPISILFTLNLILFIQQCFATVFIILKLLNSHSQLILNKVYIR